MGLLRSYRNLYFIMPIIFVSMLLFAACGSTGSTLSSPSSNAAQSVNISATATATESLMIRKMTLIGSATAKLVSGTTFEVDGKIKNGDSKQHDIFVQVALLDATGKQIASATENVDNVAGNTTASFAIKGTTPQATWKTVNVTVVKVTENINGSGDD